MECTSCKSYLSCRVIYRYRRDGIFESCNEGTDCHCHITGVYSFIMYVNRLFALVDTALKSPTAAVMSKVYLLR